MREWQLYDFCPALPYPPGTLTDILKVRVNIIVELHAHKLKFLGAGHSPRQL